MATFTINIPDAQVPRVVNALCELGQYQDTIEGQPNPQTKAQFAKGMIQSFIRETVRHIEGKSLQAASQDALQAQMDSLKAAIEGSGITVG